MSLPLRNLYKCKQVACNVVVAYLFVYPPFLYGTLFLPVYFFIPFIYLLYFCLLVDHVNKSIVFDFGTFPFS